MDLPPELLKCVAFIGYRTRTGDAKVAGTCFFVSRPTPFPGLGISYVITARHVIEGLCGRGFEPLLRLNSKQHGAQLVPLPERWLFPNENDIDIAVSRFPLEEEEWDHLTVPWSVIDPDPINAADPRSLLPGDDVLIMGLFHQHKGELRNIPIVRVGTIAALPQELVLAQMGSEDNPREAMVEAFLVETRSQRGLSGSPAFVYETRHASITRQLMHPGALYSPREHRRMFFLGLVKGHFGKDEYATVEDAEGRSRANAGISLVVPYGQIVDFFEEPQVTEPEEEAMQEYQRSQNATTDADT